MLPVIYLQIYYLIINIYGWWKWLHPNEADATSNNQLKISTNSRKCNLITFSFIFASLVLIIVVFFLEHIHVQLPQLFKLPSWSPFFTDCFITMVNIVAMYFMAKKKIEHWYLWFIADLTSAIFFYSQNVKFLALEYFVFLFFAFLGYFEWKKELNTNN